MDLFGWLFGAPNILKLKQTRNIEGLLKALRYKEVETRCQAAEAVCEVFGATRRSLDKKTVDALLDALLTVVNDQHEITEVRQTAAMALAKIGDTGWSLLDKKTVDALLTVVNDQHEITEVRQTAAMALAKIGNTRSVASLLAILQRTDEASDVQGTVAKAVQQLAEFFATCLAVMYIDGRPRVNDVLKQLGDVAVEPLIAVLRSRDQSFGYELRKTYAAQLLGEIGDKRAITPLIGALTDEIKSVRHKALEALERIGGPQVEKALAQYRAERRAKVQTCISALSAESVQERVAAAKALGELEDSMAIGPLALACLDPFRESEYIRISPYDSHVAVSYPVRFAAECALRSIGGLEADRVLKEQDALESAMASLGQASGSFFRPRGDVDKAIRQLSSLIKSAINQETVRVLLAEHIRFYTSRGVSQQTVEELAQALEDKDEQVRDIATKVLECIGGPAAERVLANYRVKQEH